MIDSRKRSELARCSYLMHRDQLEHDFKNQLNAPHDFSIRSFHTLLAGMVDGQDTSLHGSWGWGSGTGWGKSTGLCTFFRGAGSKYLLGQPGGSWNHQTQVSAIITAARIESLYELERQMTDPSSRFPIPSHRIMVLHSDTSKKFRASDEGKDAPICLVAHNKLKHIAKRPTDDQQEFLSYRGQVRDICIVDEAFNEAEASYVDQGLLKNAMRNLLINAKHHDRAVDFKPLVEVVEPLFLAIDAENIRQDGLNGLQRSEGMIHCPALSEGDVKELEHLVRRITMSRDDRALLSKFLKMIPSPLRVIRGKQGGVVTVINTMPSLLTNRIELNASFEIGMLSALDPSVKNADEHFPMLQELKTKYNLPTGLSGIIDYSDMHITHLQRGGGKSTMEGHLKDIRQMTSSTKEVLDFYVNAIKATPEDEGVLVLTYLEDGVDYVDQLGKVFDKAGIDMTKTVLDDSGNPVPRIAFTTYGAHLSTNKFRHCSTGILAGVQQRHKAEVAGSMCGMRKSIASPVDFAEVDLVHQAIAAADAQQGIGRLRCRQVVKGRAKAVRIYISHHDTKDQQFKARLLRAFPQATWIDQASENRKKASQAGKVMVEIGKYLEGHYEGKAVPTRNVKEPIREAIGSVTFSEQVFRIAIRMFLKENPAWCRQGHALIKVFDRMGFGTQSEHRT